MWNRNNGRNKSGNKHGYGARRAAGVLAVLLALLVVPLSIMGYRINTVTGTATVEEAIELSQDTFAVLIYPDESHTEQIILTNHSSADLLVDLRVIQAGPDGGSGSELNVTLPANVSVPGNGTATISLIMRAGASAPTGEYFVQIVLDR